MRTVLHVLSQHPSLTGSGITLDALSRAAERAGWKQSAVVGAATDDPHPGFGLLSPERIHPLVFGRGELPFALPGMSDVMPYASTVFSTMNTGRLDTYRAAWREHLKTVIAKVRPDFIHSHHVWLLSAMIKDIAPDLPVVTHCHATGLRQMRLCPHLADEVRRGCRRIDRFVVLHQGHAGELSTALGAQSEEGAEAPRAAALRERIRIVGAGYRDEVFHAEGRGEPAPERVLYVGKYSRAKGVPELLDAVERLRADGVGIELHVVGGGGGDEGRELAERMDRMGEAVVRHGMLDQPRLADVMRTMSTLVLPSYYEGLPLVLAEAAACGCQLVATRLPGIVGSLAPHLGELLELVDMPRLVGPDQPVAEDLPAFVGRLADGLRRRIEIPRRLTPVDLAAALEPLTWSSVFGHVEAVWEEVLQKP